MNFLRLLSTYLRIRFILHFYILFQKDINDKQKFFET